LHGADKKAWSNYKAELEAQEKNLEFLNQFKGKGHWEAPVRQNKKKSEGKKEKE